MADFKYTGIWCSKSNPPKYLFIGEGQNRVARFWVEDSVNNQVIISPYTDNAPEELADFAYIISESLVPGSDFMKVLKQMLKHEVSGGCVRAPAETCASIAKLIEKKGFINSNDFINNLLPVINELAKELLDVLSAIDDDDEEDDEDH